jgi:sortase A
VVDGRRVQILNDPDTPRLTLVTCYPFGALHPGGPLRYVVAGVAMPADGPRLTL